MTPRSPSTAERPRVLVVGGGAIGGLLAARLALAGVADVTLAVRTAFGGLVLDDGTCERAAPVRVLADPAAAPPADVVVVATKAYDSAGVTPWLRAAGGGAPVVVAQNGIEHADRFAGVVEADRIVPMIVKHGAERPDRGRVRHTLVGDLKLPDVPGARSFAELANAAGLDARVIVDFDDALWTKLAYNLVGNSLSTLTDLPVCEIGRRGALRALARLLLEECGAAAATRGVRLPLGLAESMLDEFAVYPPSVRSSMWQDLRGGRPFEHDAISGAVVRVAEASGQVAPHTRAVTLLLDSLSPTRTGG